MGSRQLYFGLFSIISLVFLFLSLNSPDKDRDFVFLAAVSENFNKDISREPFLASDRVLFSSSPEFILIDKSGIVSASPPLAILPQTLGVLVEEPLPQDQGKVIVEYEVKSGDTLSSIAENFGISLNTLLWANNLNKNSVLKIGQKLVVLPVSGVVHHVKSGDTVSEIAKKYKAQASEIVVFNELSNENDIYIGDILIIPGGVLPPPAPKPAPSPTPSVSNQNLATSQFIPPLASPYIITQGRHWYNAVDLSYTEHACGRSVFASDSGVVQKTGYDRIAGNYVRVLHPNGVITFYGHLSAINVSIGQQVSAGQTIGAIGNTGYTVGRTGCHLHFEVRGAGNPFIR